MARIEEEINSSENLTKAIFNVRTRILKKEAFRLHGRDHGVTLHPSEIIKCLQDLVTDNSGTKISLPAPEMRQATGFIEDGFIAIYSISPNNSFVNRRRKQALRLLRYACSKKIEKIAESNKNSHLEDSIEPYVGMQLAAVREIEPDKYALLERSRPR